MRRPILVLALFWAVANPIRPECPSFQATTARIACWNLSGLSAIDRDKATTFARAITYLDPEVLVVVEVNPDFFAAEILADLNEVGIYYDRAILDQTASQNIAILTKRGVQLSNPRLIPGSDDNNKNLRKALAADVKIGQFDFILIAVHMKAGRDPKARGVRDNQAKAIAEFIRDATQGNEKDVLVLGDYNMIPAEDQSNFDNMNPDSFLHFVTDSLVDRFTHIGPSGAGNLLDGYAISRVYTKEYIARSVRIIDMHDVLGLPLLDYRDRISDHLPVTAEFRILEDDD